MGRAHRAIISDSALLDAPVAYVSFSPGSFAVGSRVTIQNRRTAASLGCRHCREVDWTRFQFTSRRRRFAGFRNRHRRCSGQSASLRWCRRPPSLRRADRARGLAARTSAIDARVRVVFSEPVDARDGQSMPSVSCRTQQPGEGSVTVSPRWTARRPILPTDYLAADHRRARSRWGAITGCVTELGCRRR